MSRITPSNPANTLTPAYSTVSSPGGFQSGDLVYYKDSSFGTIPGDALTIAPFNITATNAAIGGPFGRNSFVGSLNEDINRAVSGKQRFAATLTNGNIVVVYSGGNNNNTNQGLPRFRIITDNFVTVVPETSISLSDGVWNSAIGVAPLVGGGFAVAYSLISGPSLRVAVFSNTGAVVTAPFTPAGWSSLNFTDIEPLPNGGFVVAGNQTPVSNQYRVATFTATGTQVNSNSPVITTFGGNDTPLIAVLSDGRFVVLTRNNTTSCIVTGFNADCTTVGAGQTFSVATPEGGGAYSIGVLSNNEVVIASSSGGITTVRKYFIGSNSLSGPTDLNFSSNAWLPYLVTLPGDNIAVIMLVTSGRTALQIVTSSFANVSLVNYNGISMDTGNGNRLAICAVLTPSKLTYFVSNAYTNNVASPATPIQYFQFNSAASYAPIYRRTQSLVVATANSSVSGYARGNSNPNRAAFLANTNTTISSTQTGMTGSNYVRAPYVARGGVTFLDSCMMLNGRMVVAYTTGSTNAGFLVVDASGTVVTDVNFPTIGNSTYIKCAALNNGKLVVGFGTSTSAQALYLQVYDSNFVLQASTTFFAATGISPNNVNVNINGGFALSSIGTDRFIVGYTNAADNRLWWGVLTDSIVYVTGIDVDGSVTGQAPEVSANIDGSFAFTGFRTSPGTCRVSRWVQTGTNTWEQIFGTNASWSGSNKCSTTAKMAPGGTAFHLLSPGTNGNDFQLLAIGNQDNIITTHSLGASDANMSGAVAIGATGEVVAVKVSNTYGESYTVFSPGTSYVSSGSLFSNTLNVSGENTSTGQNGPNVCLECLYERVYALIYRGTGNELYIGLFATASATYSSTLVAGVTPSNPAFTPSPTNGYYLAGISASECAAGGTGVLQINGAATLNSQYPAGTTSQSFDFNAPSLDVGVRGTIAGRNVILSGGK